VKVAAPNRAAEKAALMAPASEKQNWVQEPFLLDGEGAC